MENKTYIFLRGGDPWYKVIITPEQARLLDWLANYDLFDDDISVADCTGEFSFDLTKGGK